jgi:hypothetical protein
MDEGTVVHPHNGMLFNTETEYQAMKRHEGKLMYIVSERSEF